jgi:hypothetical protein
MTDPHPFPVLDWIHGQVTMGPLPSHEDNTRHRVESVNAQADIRSWIAKGLITFGPMHNAPYVPPEIPVRSKRLISVVHGPEAINSKKGSKRARLNYAPKK